jgi:hypothetical protein
MPTNDRYTLTTSTHECADGRTCPGLHTLPGREERFVIGKTDADAFDQLGERVGEGEQLVAVPAYVPSMLLDVNGLGALIDAHYRAPGDTLFRMETLPEYAVDSDGDDWQRWLSGATEPTWSRKRSTLDMLAREKANGQRQRRVRRFGHDLTMYERFACDFGYAFNAEHEDIRVLRDGEHDVPELLEHDYWTINGQMVVPMLYDGHGRYVGAGVLPPDRTEEYVHDEQLAWDAAEPWADWWGRHTELHRAAAA